MAVPLLALVASRTLHAAGSRLFVAKAKDVILGLGGKASRSLAQHHGQIAGMGTQVSRTLSVLPKVPLTVDKILARSEPLRVLTDRVLDMAEFEGLADAPGGEKVIAAAAAINVALNSFKVTRNVPALGAALKNVNPADLLSGGKSEHRGALMELFKSATDLSQVLVEQGATLAAGVPPMPGRAQLQPDPEHNPQRNR